MGWLGDLGSRAGQDAPYPATAMPIPSSTRLYAIPGLLSQVMGPLGSIFTVSDAVTMTQTTIHVKIRILDAKAGP